MGKRRAAGEGNIRKRSNGQWEGRIVIGHKADGSSIFKYVYGKTQKELTEKLRHTIGDYQGVELTEERRLTLGQWLIRWLEEYVRPTDRATTLDGYARDLRNHVLPTLGNRPIGSITTADVQRLYNALRENGRLTLRKQYGPGLSNTTIRRVHTLLHQAMDAAVREHLIPANPVSGAEAPKRHYKTMRVLNARQLDTLIKAIEREPIWHDFFYTELTTGLRRGEICGLRWGDFDSKEGTIKIQRTVKRLHGEFVYDDTKTFAGERTIYLPESTADLLRMRKKEASSVWIFPNPLKPEEPTNPGSAYTKLKSILKESGLPSIRFHDLRHTFATHALANGVDAKTLSGILGHTDASFTLDTYTHVTSDMKEKASQVIGDFMEEIFGKELKPWQREENPARAASI